MMYELKLWTYPPNYFGKSWEDYYIFLGQTRDSDCLTRSNFICGLEAIGGEQQEPVNLSDPDRDLEWITLIVHENHWACGWVEWIAIRKDNLEAIEKAKQVLEALEEYPVVNDDHLSNLEHDEADEVWASMNWIERVEHIRDQYTYTEFSFQELLGMVKHGCLPPEYTSLIN